MAEKSALTSTVSKQELHTSPQHKLAQKETLRLLHTKVTTSWERVNLPHHFIVQWLGKAS